MTNTLKKLEYDKVIQFLCNETSFEGGRKLAEKLIPYHKLDKIEKLLTETEEAMELLRYGSPDFLQKNVVMDMHFLKLQSSAVLQPSDLKDFYYLLLSSKLIKNYVKNPQASVPNLVELSEDVFYDNNLENKIINVIDENGILRDDASPALKEIRRQINNNRQHIKNYLADFIHADTKKSLLQDALVTERDGRYVIPVKQEFRYEVKGIVHDESASGATVFIEPMAVVENNNKIRQLQIQEKREVERILAEISDVLHAYVYPLKRNIKLLAIFDLIFARARLAYKMDAFRPEMNTEGILEITNARHPLLGKKAVPISIHLGDRFDLLIITGPNTGGKTVVLKTIGLLSLMAMSGLFIPAREKSKIAIYDNIYVDIGDEQSIEQSLSTFSGHMKNVVEILGKVTQHSLVLFDELGSGTDPTEGSALSQAILEELAHRKIHGVITTHLSDLKNFAYQNENVENACVEFDQETLQPTYQVTIGIPGQSNALAIVSHLGMPKNILSRAHDLLPQHEVEVGEMITQVKLLQHDYEKKLRDLANDLKKAEEEKERIEEEKIKIEEERQEIIHNSRVKAREYLQSITMQADEALDEIREVIRKNAKSNEAPKWHEIEKHRQKLNGIKTEDPNPRKKNVGKSQPIHVGDEVRLLDLNQNGEVLEIHKDKNEARIQVGVMRFNIALDRLQVTQESAPEKLERTFMSSYLEKVKTISPEIDLRGENADDAIFMLDKYINEALLAGLDFIRIIHGKGTGVLRAAVQQHLKSFKPIKSFRGGLAEEGGAGVTIAYFK